MFWAFVASLAVAMVSSMLLAQSWAKDAGHAVINMRQDQHDRVSFKNTELIQEVLRVQERMIAQLEALDKRVEKLEK